MFCIHCGAKLHPDGAYCMVCGARLGDNGRRTSSANPGRGLSIAALVLGICAIVFSGSLCAAPCIGYTLPGICAVCAIVGIILGAVGISRSKAAGLKSAMGVVGLILSIVSLVLVAIHVVLMITGFSLLLLVELLAASETPPYVSPYFEYY